MRRAPGVKVVRPAPTLTADEVAYVRSLVIWQDSFVLALNKPPGLSAQGGRGQHRTLDDLLHAFARSNGKRPQLVHRLDRDTSGVILAAKTVPAAAALGRALMARQVAKTYLALVGGSAPEPPSGVVDAALRREEQGREAYTRVAPAGEGDAALTRYRTLGVAQGAAALVEARPQTGRMHQIRVHMAHIGRPLLGDVRYGGALVAGGKAVPRLMLHALALEFPHPDGGRRRVEAPPPEDFRRLSEALGLAQGEAGGAV